MHLDLQHLAYNIGALLALGALYETASFGGPRRLLLGVLGFGAGGRHGHGPRRLARNAPILRAVGRAEHTLCGGHARGWRETRHPLWLAAFFADVAKIGVETAFGPIFSSGLAWPPLPAAHIAGLAAGCMLHVASIASIEAGLCSKCKLEAAGRRAHARTRQSSSQHNDMTAGVRLQFLHESPVPLGKMNCRGARVIRRACRPPPHIVVPRPNRMFGTR